MACLRSRGDSSGEEFIHIDRMGSGVSCLITVIHLQSYTWTGSVLQVTAQEGTFSELANPLDVFLHTVPCMACLGGIYMLYQELCSVSRLGEMISWTVSGHSRVGKGMHLNRGIACSLPLETKEGSCKIKAWWNMFSSWHRLKPAQCQEYFCY